MITNLEKLSRLNNMANLIYDTYVYTTAYCDSSCFCENGAERSDCLECIKKWLESEADA